MGKVEGIEQGTGAAAEAAAEAEEEAGAKTRSTRRFALSAKGEGEEGDMDVNAVHSHPVASSAQYLPLAAALAPSRLCATTCADRGCFILEIQRAAKKDKETQRI